MITASVKNDHHLWCCMHLLFSVCLMQNGRLVWEVFEMNVPVLHFRSSNVWGLFLYTLSFENL